MKGNAHVKITVDGFGLGSIIVNDIHMEQVVRGFSVRSVAGEATIVTLEMLADQVEFETSEDVKSVIKWLTPDPTPLRMHEFTGGKNGIDVCRVCRQVRGVAAPTCPGPLDNIERMPIKP